MKDAATRYGEFLTDVQLGPRARARVEATAALMRLAMKNARTVIVWSRRAADEIEAVYGVRPVVLKGCIPDTLPKYVAKADIRQRLSLPQASRVVLTVSRLDPIKRVDLLITAFSQLKRHAPNAVLVIAGTGPDEERLRQLAGETGQNNVIFAGYVPDNDLWDCYATSDIFVTPALADFNIAPFEALALKRRVIWSSEMETDEPLLRSGAVISAQPTPDAFADAILKALSCPEPPKCDLAPYLWSTRYAQLASLYLN
jgi:glycosyltransferase involved in cell wall biosynthesis